MTATRDRYCSFCGTAYVPPLQYPRACVNVACGQVVWANPIPVSVVLVPIRREGREGLMVVRRGIEPAKGRLVLAGGFVEEHESWQVAGAREVFEEAGVTLDARALQPFWFASSEPRPNRVLLFSIAKPVDAVRLTPFTATEEASERGIVHGPDGLDDVLAFPLHAHAARRFFAERAIHGGHDYEII